MSDLTAVDILIGPGQATAGRPATIHHARMRRPHGSETRMARRESRLVEA